MAGDGIIPVSLTAAAVRSYIDFDGHDAERGEPSIQAELQSEGVAGLWGLLRQQGHAYLGDEVGMGKTRQAMGVIATQFLDKPDSRVVIVCPSATVQVQWQSEWAQFLRSCYRLLDNRLLATADAAQIEDLHMHENLREFHEALRAGEGRIHLLRYSSFSRPLPLDDTSPANMLMAYARHVGVPDVAALTATERALAAQHAKPAEDWKDSMGHALGRAYCERIGAMLTDGVRVGPDGVCAPAHPLDLVIFDEAQYLRHTGNYQNQHIRLMFGRNVDHWLFLSATPLHSSEHDILSLDTYLCRRLATGDATSPKIPDDCGACEHAPRCSRVAWQLSEQRDVVDVLNGFMIRRTRTHGGGDKTRYGKIEYRHYAQVRHSGADDPFLALTMALVQKRLVEALAGRNNQFRQGECASFESLSSSLGRYNGPEALPEFETGKDHKQRKETDAAPDRNAIDKLNQSFLKAMNLPGGFGLPHAKIHRAADELFKRSMADGSVEKTLVFVRRIDTVEELRDLLHRKFQQNLDGRIEAWRALLAGPGFDSRATLWKGSLWEQEVDDQGAHGEAQAGEDDAPPDSGQGPGNAGYRDQTSLPYFEALKQHSQVKKRNGILFSFRSQLLRSDDLGGNPLHGFLLKQPRGVTAEPNRLRWERLLGALFDQSEVNALRADSSQGWLFADITSADADAYKLASLQRCLLQSIRQTDLLVDLFILNKYVKRTPNGAEALADKLLWLLEHGSDHLPEKIERYLENQKEKLRHWITHFDLIVDKCFRGGDAADWAKIHDERVLPAFRAVAPVVGRSGRLKNTHAVQQFMFPTYPNILVCTDVLKEGVDMHLFCDRVVHYGVAWTSGDLEQRIGRVDRLGSQIGRRIHAHTAASKQPLPRLAVEFPYLVGTLDMYQVRNVIREKIASDLRLDLGKRKDEIRELDTGGLSPDSPMYGGLAMQGRKDGVVFFPDSVRCVRGQCPGQPIRLGEGMRQKRATDVVQPRRPIDDRSNETNAPMPGFDAMLVRRRASREHAMVRRSLDPKTGEMLLTDDYLAIRESQPEPVMRKVALQAGPYSVSELEAAGFAFDPGSNTVAMRVTLPIADARAGEGDLVLAEAIGEQFWLLRAPVHRVEDCATGKGGIVKWMAQRNSGRILGFLMQDAGIVWCAAVILKSGGAELRLLEQLAPQLARIAAYWRQPGILPGAFGYRAPTGFPCVGENLAWKDSMNQSDVINCGRVLAGVQAWFSEAFGAVLGGLYDDEGRPVQDGLKVQPLALLPGGLLHLQTAGRERFRLQAFLDPTGASAKDGPVSGPQIWWELVASMNSHGARPALPFSSIAGFPHADPDSWNGDFVDGVGVFTGVDDSNYRYVAFCHSPADWDRAKQELVEAWKAVRTKIRTGSNFQHQWCREKLRAAVAPLTAYTIPEQGYGT